MIGIVDAGMGNLGAVENMLRRLGFPVQIMSRPAELGSAERLILPGIGSFDRGRSLLDERGFTPVLNELALERGLPVLGICLGMQLMTLRSDEGNRPGLGWVEAETLRFRLDGQDQKRLKIPHMGWDEVRFVNGGTLFDGWEGEARFYFVHSYWVDCHDEADVAALGHHGRGFVAAFQHGNIFGVQFHPEKSHRFGMQLLRRFAGAPG